MAKLFKLTDEDLVRTAPEDFREEGHPPDAKEGENGEVKCGCCNWETGTLYVLADSLEEAKELYREGEAGICGSCMGDMLMESEYDIFAKGKLLYALMESDLIGAYENLRGDDTWAKLSHEMREAIKERAKQYVDSFCGAGTYSTGDALVQAIEDEEHAAKVP